MTEPLRRVLFVEDEAALRSAYARYFAKRYDMAFAGTGAQGLEEFEASPPDILVLDMQLPDTDGLALLKETENTATERGVGDSEAMYKIAQAYGVLGDKTSALRVLRRSIEGGFFSYPYFASDPLLDSVRSEPGFEPLMTLARIRHEKFKKTFF